ncbi:autotransporter-associated beta strand repeat-containing protein [Ensifer adhaerens]|nr:autotransporter-associated beta strand repeat-containing protein [Ensifer adhaerens]
MIVSGAGTLALTGNNTYTGTITVNAGTLLVNGSSVWSVVGERGDGV